MGTCPFLSSRSPPIRTPRIRDIEAPAQGTMFSTLLPLIAHSRHSGGRSLTAPSTPMIRPSSGAGAVADPSAYSAYPASPRAMPNFRSSSAISHSPHTLAPLDLKSETLPGPQKSLLTPAFGAIAVPVSETEVFAAKVMKKSFIRRAGYQQNVLTERKILSTAKHPLITKLFAASQDATYLYLLLELVCGGDLARLIRSVHASGRHASVQEWSRLSLYTLSPSTLTRHENTLERLRQEEAPTSSYNTPIGPPSPSFGASALPTHLEDYDSASESSSSTVSPALSANNEVSDGEEDVGGAASADRKMEGAVDIDNGGEKESVEKIPELMKLSQIGLPPAVYQFYTLQVLESLEYLHKTLGAVHRDLKSANVLLNHTGHIRLTDFGSALFLPNTVPFTIATASNTHRHSSDLSHPDTDPSTTAAGTAKNSAPETDPHPEVTDGPLAGTSGYIAPEVVHRNVVEGASDLWSLGCMLYEACTGSVPFAGVNDFLSFQKTLDFDWMASVKLAFAVDHAMLVTEWQQNLEKDKESGNIETKLDKDACTTTSQDLSWADITSADLESLCEGDLALIATKYPSIFHKPVVLSLPDTAANPVHSGSCGNDNGAKSTSDNGGVDPVPASPEFSAQYLQHLYQGIGVGTVVPKVCTTRAHLHRLLSPTTTTTTTLDAPTWSGCGLSAAADLAHSPFPSSMHSLLPARAATGHPEASAAAPGAALASALAATSAQTSDEDMFSPTAVGTNKQVLRFPLHIPPACKAFILALLHPIPEKRLGITGLFAKPISTPAPNGGSPLKCTSSTVSRSESTQDPTNVDTQDALLDAVTGLEPYEVSNVAMNIPSGSNDSPSRFLCTGSGQCSKRSGTSAASKAKTDYIASLPKSLKLLLNKTGDATSSRLSRVSQALHPLSYLEYIQCRCLSCTCLRCDNPSHTPSSSNNNASHPVACLCCLDIAATLTHSLRVISNTVEDADRPLRNQLNELVNLYAQKYPSSYSTTSGGQSESETFASSLNCCSTVVSLAPPTPNSFRLGNLWMDYNLLFLHPVFEGQYASFLLQKSGVLTTRHHPFGAAASSSTSTPGISPGISPGTTPEHSRPSSPAPLPLLACPPATAASAGLEDEKFIAAHPSAQGPNGTTGAGAVPTGISLPTSKLFKTAYNSAPIASPLPLQISPFQTPSLQGFPLPPPSSRKIASLGGTKGARQLISCNHLTPPLTITLTPGNDDEEDFPTSFSFQLSPQHSLRDSALPSPISGPRSLPGSVAATPLFPTAKYVPSHTAPPPLTSPALGAHSGPSSTAESMMNSTLNNTLNSSLNSTLSGSMHRTLQAIIEPCELETDEDSKKEEASETSKKSGIPTFSSTLLKLADYFTPSKKSRSRTHSPVRDGTDSDANSALNLSSSASASAPISTNKAEESNGVSSTPRRRSSLGSFFFPSLSLNSSNKDNKDTKDHKEASSNAAFTSSAPGTPPAPPAAPAAPFSALQYLQNTRNQGNRAQSSNQHATRAFSKTLWPVSPATPLFVPHSALQVLKSDRRSRVFSGGKLPHMGSGQAAQPVENYKYETTDKGCWVLSDFQPPPQVTIFWNEYMMRQMTGELDKEEFHDEELEKQEEAFEQGHVGVGQDVSKRVASEQKGKDPQETTERNTLSSAETEDANSSTSIATLPPPQASTAIAPAPLSPTHTHTSRHSQPPHHKESFFLGMPSTPPVTPVTTPVLASLPMPPDLPPLLPPLPLADASCDFVLTPTPGHSHLHSIENFTTSTTTNTPTVSTPTRSQHHPLSQPLSIASDTLSSALSSTISTAVSTANTTANTAPDTPKMPAAPEFLSPIKSHPHHDVPDTLELPYTPESSPYATSLLSSRSSGTPSPSLVAVSRDLFANDRVELDLSPTALTAPTLLAVSGETNANEVRSGLDEPTPLSKVSEANATKEERSIEPIAKSATGEYDPNTESTTLPLPEQQAPIATGSESLLHATLSSRPEEKPSGTPQKTPEKLKTSLSINKTKNVEEEEETMEPKQPLLRSASEEYILNTYDFGDHGPHPYRSSTCSDSSQLDRSSILVPASLVLDLSALVNDSYLSSLEASLANAGNSTTTSPLETADEAQAGTNSRFRSYTHSYSRPQSHTSHSSLTSNFFSRPHTPLPPAAYGATNTSTHHHHHHTVSSEFRMSLTTTSLPWLPLVRVGWGEQVLRYGVLGKRRQNIKALWNEVSRELVLVRGGAMGPKLIVLRVMKRKGVSSQRNSRDGRKEVAAKAAAIRKHDHSTFSVFSLEDSHHVANNSSVLNLSHVTTSTTIGNQTRTSVNLAENANMSGNIGSLGNTSGSLPHSQSNISIASPSLGPMASPRFPPAIPAPPLSPRYSDEETSRATQSIRYVIHLVDYPQFAVRLRTKSGKPWDYQPDHEQADKDLSPNGAFGTLSYTEPDGSDARLSRDQRVLDLVFGTPSYAGSLCPTTTAKITRMHDSRLQSHGSTHLAPDVGAGNTMVGADSSPSSPMLLVPPLAAQSPKSPKSPTMSMLPILPGSSIATETIHQRDNTDRESAASIYSEQSPVDSFRTRETAEAMRNKEKYFITLDCNAQKWASALYAAWKEAMMLREAHNLPV